ncbi:hypothetical protein [Chitinilyticum piscinae]|uniref:Uncharacterized protein n=1 Tax=Chitinilyticum piscinae TaxID=2866724 RepID=A0A8J7FL52_9NEIS|nr:hypothetical protein [Chitinilyticum piscinae]MBE9610067.1 hypothetical protein [Chitinilyticum piscinae]
MFEHETRQPLSLTGPDSHTLIREAGLGSLTIAPAEQCKHRCDLRVNADDPINWDCLTPFTVPAGSPWPRWLNYVGSDTGVFAWAEQRVIESLSWTPTRSCEIDASAANIQRLSIHLSKGIALRIRLPAATYLHLSGDLSQFTAINAAEYSGSLALAPDTDRQGPPQVIPLLDNFLSLRDLTLFNEPLRQPLDAASALKLPQLSRLSLYGAIANLGELAKLTGLESLQLRFMNDLSELPAPESWPKLTNLLAWNVDEVAGKALRAWHRRHLKAVGEQACISLSATQLRKPDWFVTEYGLPFADWTPKNAKAATKAYRIAQAAIAKAKQAAEIEQALIVFGQVLNKLPGLETCERDDAYSAFCMLAAHTEVNDDIEDIFGSVCDF